jgi:exodeoxyribonuclease VII small subunit
MKMAKKEENFEELMKKLEEITNKLEKEELNLDESVELFEEGMKISKQCSSKLENAEKKITMLLNTDPVEEENFIPED